MKMYFNIMPVICCFIREQGLSRKGFVYNTKGICEADKLMLLDIIATKQTLPQK